MKKTASKEIKIELPGDLVEIVSRKEIITMLLDKALSKAEYLGSRCREFEEKYSTDFISFKKKVEETQEENFKDWDDLIVWEGYELGHKEWGKKYEELKKCSE